MKHTPGPWIKDKWGTLKGSNGETVMEYNSGAALATLPTPESVANTHLRNAAPELLEALKMVVEGYQGGYFSSRSQIAIEFRDQMYTKLTAAIRNAEEGK